jgi:AraC-like DNA-binding protein
MMPHDYRDKEEPKADRARLRVIAELDGTEAMVARFVTQRFRPHYHETFLVGVTEVGTEVFEARGARHFAPAGSLRLFNPGEVHTGAPPEGGVWAYRCLYPTPTLLGDIAQDAGHCEPVWFPNMVVSDPATAGELLAALRALDRATSTLERSTRVRMALAGIIMAYAGGARPTDAALQPKRHEPRAIAAATAYIGDRIAEDFSLAELARAAGMSPYHLVRVFRACRGLTPFAYQTQLRIERARDLLARGLGVKATAAACGFHDRSHLARVFRAVVGISPADYRQAVTGRRRSKDP